VALVLGVLLTAVAVAASPAPAVTLVFVGDVMLGRAVAAALAGDWAAAFDGVQPWLAGADLALANLESPLTRAPFQGGRFDLRAPPEAVQALAAAGFDVVSLANNHALDGGAAGLAETLETLAGAGIKAVVESGLDNLLGSGPGGVQNVHVRGVRIAVVGLWDSGGALDTAPVALAATRADLVVVLVHWGAEYEPVTPRQREWARELARAGAGLIVGHGPHVLQPVEQVERVWVAYSLGNFLFDQPFADTRQGVVLRVMLKGGRVVAFDAVPAVTRDGRVRLAGGEERAADLASSE
jgi:poly-gamma-glutamate capsule biosynthesis protein CapA/YwtB (metallophosphatase superfamily)